MEVRAGFKHTECGVIPEEWSVAPLGTLIEGAEYGSGSPSKKHGRVPVLRMGNLQGGKIDWGDLVFTDDAAEIQRFTLRKGDVLFNRTNTIELVGKTAIYEGDREAIFAGYLIRVVARRALLEARYLNYVMNTEAARKYGARVLSVAVGQANINAEKLKTYPIPLPPTVDEQKVISAALADADALLDGLERLIAKKRDLKQAAMQQLLTGRSRLPGFSDDWDVKRLGEICEISMGRTPPRANKACWGRGYTWLSIADLQSKVVTDSKEEVTELGAAMMTIVPKGTLLMSFKLSIGRLAFAGRDLFTNEAICAFHRLQADVDYLYYALSRVDFSLYGKQAVKGYTLNKDSLRLVEVNLPSPDEQRAIAAALSDMDAEIVALEAQREKADNLKQAMMQELLTGKTRLATTGGAYV